MDNKKTNLWQMLCTLDTMLCVNQEQQEDKSVADVLHIIFNVVCESGTTRRPIFVMPTLNKMGANRSRCMASQYDHQMAYLGARAWLLREAHYVALSSQSAGNEARA